MPLDDPSYTCISGLICATLCDIVYMNFRINICHWWAIINMYFRVNMWHWKCHHIPLLECWYVARMGHRLPVLQGWYVPLDMPAYTCTWGLICVTGCAIIYFNFRDDICHWMILIIHHINVLQGWYVPLYVTSYTWTSGLICATDGLL